MPGPGVDRLDVTAVALARNGASITVARWSAMAEADFIGVGEARRRDGAGGEGSWLARAGTTVDSSPCQAASPPSSSAASWPVARSIHTRRAATDPPASS